MQPTRTSFGVIFLLWAAGLGAAAQYGKVSVIYDQLPGVYPAAGAALEFAVSIVGLVGIIMGGVAGAVVAGYGARRTVLLALWGGAALSCVQALFPPLSVMLMLRAAEGLSHLALVVALPTLIAQLSAPRHLGFTLSLWGTFFGVAYTALVWFGLPLVAQFGLPSLFLAHGVWMAIAALVLAPVLPRSAASRAQVPRLRLRTVLADHVELYSSPRIAAPAVGWLFYTFCFLALLTLIPPFIAPEVRVWVVGAMPLVSILSSMTLGVLLIRMFGAVMVVMLGFASVIATLLWLLAVPGGPAACLAFTAALGLVQGASFAAVPQLNDSARGRALANGGIAQMGNLGNTLGTPVLAAMIAGAGYGGLIWSAICVLVLGLLAHLALAHLRKS